MAIRVGGRLQDRLPETNENGQLREKLAVGVAGWTGLEFVDRVSSEVRRARPDTAHSVCAWFAHVRVVPHALFFSPTDLRRTRATPCNRTRIESPRCSYDHLQTFA